MIADHIANNLSSIAVNSMLWFFLFAKRNLRFFESKSTKQNRFCYYCFLAKLFENWSLTVCVSIFNEMLLSDFLMHIRARSAWHQFVWFYFIFCVSVTTHIRPKKKLQITYIHYYYIIYISITYLYGTNISKYTVKSFTQTKRKII